MPETTQPDPSQPDAFEEESDWARRPWLVVAGLVLVIGSYFVLRLGPEEGYRDDLEKADAETTAEEGVAPKPPGDDAPADLVQVDAQGQRVNESTEEPVQEPPRDETESVGDPSWGNLGGTAQVNGEPVPHGLVAWHHPASGERGQISIVQGEFAGEAPFGELDLVATVLEWGNLRFTEPDPSQGLRGSQLRLSERVVLDPEREQPVVLAWRFLAAQWEGRVRWMPSGEPAAGQALTIWAHGFGEAWTRCPADGRIRVSLPQNYPYELGTHLSGRWYGVPMRMGEVAELELPELRTYSLVVIDGLRQEPTDDYDAYWRPLGGRTWTPVPGLRMTGGPEVGRGTQLPASQVELLLVAPRLNLQPLQTQLVPPPAGDAGLTYTLEAGGSIGFQAPTWPDTGIIVDGPDPDPILIIDEVLRALPKGNTFAEWVSQPAVLERYPEAYFQTRRIEFNRLGEAEVKGLAPGTYYLLHWRPDVRWAPGAIDVRAGLRTQVTLGQ